MYLAATERTIEMMVVFGHYFLMFGIMILMSNFKKIDLDTAYKILFSVGIVFVLYIDFFSNGIKINMDPDMFGFFVLGLIFFVAGIGMLIAVIKNKIKPSGVDVQAVVCEHHYDGISSICIYEYEYNGIKYKRSDGYYTTKKKPPIGTIKTIKVNPDFPANATSSGIDYNLLFISIPFILMGGFMIFVSFFVK
jgi:multidrug transporter EmrE-like cation transporter